MTFEQFTRREGWRIARLVEVESPQRFPVNKDREELLRNPKPGTKAAAARDFGIDLTLVIEQLRLTPEQRIRSLDNFRDGINAMRASMRKVPPDERH